MTMQRVVGHSPCQSNARQALELLDCGHVGLVVGRLGNGWDSPTHRECRLPHQATIVTIWLTQSITECASKEEADQVWAHLKTQSDYVGGRILAPRGRGFWELTNPLKVWKVQALFDDCGADAAHLLPDGMRRVLVWPSLFKAFDIKR
jgi:hypothetical protein